MKRILVAALLLAPPVSADVWHVATPSMNIECWVGMEVGFSDVSCTIFETRAAPPFARPNNCSAAWGHEFSMGNRGPAQMMCSPPPNGPSAARSVMPYGTSQNFGGITCSSTTSGLECRNQDGHGFFLSRGTLRVF